MDDPNAQSLPEPQPEQTTVKSTDELVSEMLAGLWGRGQDRKRRLREAGFNVDEVDAAYKKAISRP